MEPSFKSLRMLVRRLTENTLRAGLRRQVGLSTLQDCWRHHQAGMLQAYITPDTRIHIWHPDLYVPGMHKSGAIHNHRFEFISTVLVGCMRNDVYTLEECVNMSAVAWPRWQVFKVIHAATGKTDDPIVSRSGAIYYARYEREIIQAGSTYEFPKWVFHESSVKELTVTLVHKLNQEEDAQAELLAPYGSTPRHAFANPPKIDREKYVKMAIEALA